MVRQIKKANFGVGDETGIKSWVVARQAGPHNLQHHKNDGQGYRT